MKLFCILGNGNPEKILLSQETELLHFGKWKPRKKFLYFRKRQPETLTLQAQKIRRNHS